VDRGLDEVRAAYRPRHEPRLAVVVSTADRDVDPMLRALAIGRDLLGQGAADRLQSGTEGVQRTSIGDRCTARPPVGHDEHGVVGRRIPIDADLVEGPVHGLAQGRAQRPRVDGRVGGQKREHGRHLRMDHPGTFCHAADPGELATAKIDLHRRLLGTRIGGHDRRGGTRARIAVVHRAKSCQDRCDLLDIQPRADQAGRSGEHEPSTEPEAFGHGGLDAARVIQPRWPGPSVGASGVGDDGRGVAPCASQGARGEQHRGGSNPVGGEGRGRGDGATLADDERDVVARPGAQASPGRGGAEAARRRDATFDRPHAHG
jgi:hypothetical protein